MTNSRNSNIVNWLLLIVVVFGLSSCSKNESKPVNWVKPLSDTISCDAYFAEVTSKGVLTNNVWNQHAAKNDTWTQCLETRQVDGEAQYGWSWSWPFGRRVIYAQPQIKVGSSPWAPLPKFDSSFPLNIKKLESLTIDHELEIETNGDHNTVTSMWLLSEPYLGTEVRKDIIAVEVMIWTYATPDHFNPAGTKFREITIDDGVWEIWYEQNWDDKSGVNDNKWAILSFRAKESSMQASIPALGLLQHAIEANLILDELYIADIELGNEIMSGAGITWVKDFSVSFTSN